MDLKRMARRILHRSLSTTLALSAFLLCASAQAQNTTASMRIEVIDEAGSPIPGVAVTIVHVPTGQSLDVVSNQEGVTTARGLLVGGPYEISIPSGGAYAADKVPDIRLELDESEVIRLTARPATFEEISVLAETVSTDLELGVSRDFTAATIEAIPEAVIEILSR